jgi:hypothetical protein
MPIVFITPSLNMVHNTRINAQCNEDRPVRMSVRSLSPKLLNEFRLNLALEA